MDDNNPTTRFPSLIETNQHDDTFVHHLIDESCQLRLLSLRCQEARDAELSCQDYALVVRRWDQASIAFCVSDGVGGSYRGDFAAHYLTQCLVDWLQALPDLSGNTQPMTKQLEKRLHHWAGVGQDELRREALPTGLPDLLREVLEEQRDQHGSETVFFGGRIDYGSTFSDQRKRPVQAIFCWMGNVSAHIFMASNKYMLEGNEQGPESDKNRWSTLRGPRGELSVLTMVFDMVDRLIIHTDGLDPMSKELATLDDEALQAKAHELLRSPTNDDMTMLDLQWSASAEILRT